jgi:membrane-associated phospholipid phosphatase
MAGYAASTLAPVGAGLLVVAFLVLVGCISARRQPQFVPATIWAALAALVGLGLSVLVAQFVGQARPYSALAHVEVLVARGHGYGFPSSHAAAAGAAACGMALARRWRLAGLSLVAALVVAFARVYVGVEYPSDVAAGLVLGALGALILWPPARLVLVPTVDWLAASPVGALVATKRARHSSPKTVPPRLPSRSSYNLLDARAVDALRTASEAARRASHDPGRSQRPKVPPPADPGS